MAVERAQDREGVSLRNVVEIRYIAPAPGIYQFDLGATGNEANFVDLNWNVAANPFNSGAGAYRGPFTFNEVIPSYSTAGDWWFYVLAGTTTLDLHYYARGRRNVTIYRRSGATFERARGPLALVDPGVKRIPLTAEETAVGCLTCFTKTPPYFYSVPTSWAKSPSQLLVPRRIAERDGLTVLP